MASRTCGTCQAALRNDARAGTRRSSGVPIRALHKYAIAHNLRKSRETIRMMASKSALRPDSPLRAHCFPAGVVTPVGPRKSITAMLAEIDAMGGPKTVWRHNNSQGGACG